MKKGTIIWLSLATAFVLIGCIIFAGAMSTVNWDLSKLSTSKYETNTYEITEDFKNISINTETADVKFVLANNDKCTVECYEDKKLKHSAKVNDGTLCIDVDNNKSWYDFISFNFTSPKLTVYLPEKEYISLLVNESTGDVEVSDAFKFENVNISVSTGSVNFAADVNNLLKIKFFQITFNGILPGRKWSESVFFQFLFVQPAVKRSCSLGNSIFSSCDRCYSKTVLGIFAMTLGNSLTKDLFGKIIPADISGFAACVTSISYF